MVHYFKNWRAFCKAEKALELKFILKYPGILCQSPITENDRRLCNKHKKAVSFRWYDEAEKIRNRLPDDVRDNPPDSRLGRLHTWAFVQTDIPAGYRDLVYEDYYRGFQDPHLHWCKTCGIVSNYNAKLPKSVFDFLLNRDESFFKFKYRDYCSEDCKNKSRNEGRKQEKITLICPICKKEYQTRSVKPAATCKKSACQRANYRKMNLISSGPGLVLP